MPDYKPAWEALPHERVEKFAEEHNFKLGSNVWQELMDWAEASVHEHNQQHKKILRLRMSLVKVIGGRAYDL